MANENSKSQKFNNAVARATGTEVAQAPTPSVVVPPGLESIIGTFTPDEVNLAMSSGKLEWAPRAIALEEGMRIRGVLEGRGGDVDLEQVDRIQGTVTIRQVSTWVVREPKSGVRVSFLTSTQLEDKLPPFIGGNVDIYVGGLIESSKGGGRRYRDFLVGGDKLPNGQQRTWAKQLAAPVVETPAALPAGAEELL